MAEALVLLPGLLCDARLWQRQADDLADIAAPWIADLTQDDSIPAMAARVLAQAPERFALAGLSMGGYVALEIMRQAPGRVTRLALLDTSAAPDGEARQAERQRAIKTLGLGRFMGVTEAMLPQLVHESHVCGPVGATVRAMAKEVGQQAFVRQQQAILTRTDSRPLLPGITVPTLIAVGEDDRMTPPPLAEAMHQAIPGARLHRFAQCGHLPPLEQPEATSALLRDWLNWEKTA
ncbi:alpha/beta fold hydrolase [Novosphingobium terrae]|uniref:alpha/beta fold hydrolase n=1 Tax=Novosphingobium terrae TaxID=2726189 RepID=UPI00198151C8|nr:alpha/beta fold hydrolase [Novosphingobium terrae]